MVIFDSKLLHKLVQFCILENMKVVISFFLLTFCCIASGKSFGCEDQDEIVWFPNPAGEGEIPAHLTPSSDSKAGNISDIHCYLYTVDNPNDPDELFLDDLTSITESHYEAGAPLKLMFHGFGGNYTHTFPWTLREEYLKIGEKWNLVLVDWSILSANPDYFGAVQNAYITSHHLGNFLTFLVDEGLASWENIHLIGFSLGGQLVGQIGNRVAPNKVARITALDPALPLFDVAHVDNKTTPDDAEFVEVIHTAANGLLGYFDPLGHVDWYPNGGRYQPGCGIDVTGSCAHARAPAMFTESVFSEIGFYGRLCESYDDFNGECAGNEALMGHHTPLDTPQGTYYLLTNGESPFAQGPLTRT